ncbi:MAG: hypothetical protein HQL32_09945, partial [Planctomycetes bacterium]|nr:hypothetical protein [Planctomycetota bacterium]
MGPRYLICTLHCDEDQNLRNNRFVVPYHGHGLRFLRPESSKQQHFPFSGDPIDGDYYYHKLCRTLSSIWSMSLGHDDISYYYSGWDFQSKFADVEKAKNHGEVVMHSPLLAFSMGDLEAQKWQLLKANEGQGDLQELAKLTSPVDKPPEDKMFASISYMSVGRNFEVQNSTRGLLWGKGLWLDRLNEIIAPYMTGYASLPTLNDEVYKLRAKKIQIHLQDQNGLGVPGAYIELYQYGEKDAFLIGQTDSKGTWDLDLTLPSDEEAHFSLIRSKHDLLSSKGLLLRFSKGHYSESHFLGSGDADYHGRVWLFAQALQGSARVTYTIKSHYQNHSSPSHVKYSLCQDGLRGELTLNGAGNMQYQLYQSRPPLYHDELIGSFAATGEVNLPVDVPQSPLYRGASQAPLSFPHLDYKLRIQDDKGVYWPKLFSLYALDEALSLSSGEGLLLVTRGGAGKERVLVYEGQAFRNILLESDNHSYSPLKTVPSLLYPGRYYQSLQTPLYGRHLLQLYPHELSEEMRVRIAFSEYKDNLGQASGICVLADQKEYIVVCDAFSEEILLFDHELKRLDAWPKKGLNAQGIAADPTDSLGFFALDRRKNDKSWLYSFRVKSGKIQLNKVWLQSLPVNYDMLLGEMGLAVTRDPSGQGELLLAITDAKRALVLEYQMDSSREKLRLINTYKSALEGSLSSQLIAPHDVVYSLEKKKVKLFCLDHKKNIKRLR